MSWSALLESLQSRLSKSLIQSHKWSPASEILSNSSSGQTSKDFGREIFKENERAQERWERTEESGLGLDALPFPNLERGALESSLPGIY